MKKNLIIAALGALLLVSLIGGVVAGAQPPGKKPDAIIKPESREPTQVTAKRKADSVTGQMTTVSDVSIPFKVLIRNPVAPFKIIRELSIVATVPLANLSNKNQGAEFYLVDAKAKLIAAVNLAGVTLSEPEIESYEILTDGNGDVYSIPMQINVRVKVGSFYDERVRIEGIEGNDYTILDPNSADLETLIADIEANTLTAFNQ
jgi:hypothetical protein